MERGERGVQEGLEGSNLLNGGLCAAHLASFVPLMWEGGGTSGLNL